MSCSHRKGTVLEKYRYYRYQGAASAGPDPQSHKLNRNCISHLRRAFKMQTKSWQSSQQRKKNKAYNISEDP